MKGRFLTIDQVTVKLGGVVVLDDVSLDIHRHEQWAITGPSGSGKTVFAHTLLGRHFHSGQVNFHAEAGEKIPRIAMVEQQHRFKNISNTSDMYYQQRFNSSDADQTITVEQELMEYSGGGNIRDEEWADLLHIRQLLSRPLIQLSNGENKRVQLAISLLSDPGLIILDNPFLGLDTEGRQTLHAVINTLAAKGVSILLITSPQEIPDSITHICQVEKGRIVFAGRKADFHPHTATQAGDGLSEEILQQLKQGGPEFSVAVKMVDVHIRYGDRVILDGINWEVRKGERWSVSGPNGAGKSTLLSLVTADNPQAYANEIYLFDRRRGSGETIWDIKQKIGFVSPELHMYFDYSATIFEVIASGLFDTIGLFRPLTQQQEEKVLLWMKLLKLESARYTRLAQLSVGQQRMVLLARALIKNPPMLILDEPCQGLDEEQSRYFKQLVTQFCEAFNTTLIYVSHYRGEIPECVDRFLELRAPGSLES